MKLRQINTILCASAVRSFRGLRRYEGKKTPRRSPPLRVHKKRNHERTCFHHLLRPHHVRFVEQKVIQPDGHIAYSSIFTITTNAHAGCTAAFSRRFAYSNGAIECKPTTGQIWTSFRVTSKVHTSHVYLRTKASFMVICRYMCATRASERGEARGSDKKFVLFFRTLRTTHFLTLCSASHCQICSVLCASCLGHVLQHSAPHVPDVIFSSCSKHMYNAVLTPNTLQTYDELALCQARETYTLAHA